MIRGPASSGTQSSRQLLTTLPEERPRAPAVPCSACGNPVDPLRAPAVLTFDDGYRFLCRESCAFDYRGGQRFRIPKTPALGVPRSDEGTPAMGTQGGSVAGLGHSSGGGGAVSRATPAVGVVGRLPAPGRGALPALRENPSAWASLAFGIAALALSLLAGESVFALASGFCSVLSALCATALAASVVGEVGMVGLAMGPVATASAAYAATVQLESGNSVGMAVGAAVAALSLLARALLDADGQSPVQSAVTALTGEFPARAKVPVAHAEDPFAMAVHQVDAEGVRTGEEVIVVKGDILPVDGVIQAGGAKVLPYPGAEGAVRRKVGDAVLAGARVLDGALRVLATRVGDQRALVRISSFGTPSSHSPAAVGRLGHGLRRYGGAVAVAVGLCAFALVDGSQPAAGWSAFAAVVIATPLLGVVRALTTPGLSAGAHGAACGIVYRSAESLERAGRVSLVAMAPHGTLTEGRPEVVEMHMVGEGDSDELVALVAAAERGTPGGPIPRAIAAYSAGRQVSPVEVRRIQHITGQGVTAMTVRNEELVVGSRRFLLESGVSVAVADTEVARADVSARTSIFVALGGRVRAVITLQDPLRVGARAAVQRMFDGGLEVVLLTGDQRGPIETLAARLDIAHVKAELLPAERAMAVRNLREAGGQVGVIGYHGEDDAAITAADVGIALGAAGGLGSEVAVALVSRDIRDAAAALWIAQAARDQTFRALRVAGVAYGVVIVAASAGLLGPGLAALVAVGVETYSLSAGARLLRRFALRLPAHS